MSVSESPIVAVSLRSQYVPVFSAIVRTCPITIDQSTTDAIKISPSVI
jgi:hypothetical protein